MMNWKLGHSYKQKLLIYVSSIFVFFAAILILLQITQDHNTKKYALASRLDAYAQVILRSADSADNLEEVLPDEMRATVIDLNGSVLFDSERQDSIAGRPHKIHQSVPMTNHLGRPEVVAALKEGHGYCIRKSETTRIPYFYYARLFGDQVIRVALPYNPTVRQFFKPHNIFVFLVVLLLLVTMTALVLLSGYLGKGVTNLLKLHIQNSEKGVAVYSPGARLEYSNSKFVQYVNTIMGQATADLNIIWKNKHFEPLVNYIDETLVRLKENDPVEPFSYIVDTSGKKFRVQVLVYPDMGFEVGIVDITAIQQNSLLKQQMTSNISHELRTPVTSIRGYLETIISCPDMPDEKKELFIERAYNQTIRLSDLIRDMALISKIEESPDQLGKEMVSLRSLSDEVFDEFYTDISQRKLTIENELADDLTIQANKTLLYAILRNLIENSIKYAGDAVTLHLECYSEHDGYLYFTYYDTGKGVPEEHLVKLFERFHRVSEGRSRDDGGSGLGLSIVRNAVAFHSGEITARNREGGGLQFFFTLKKN